MELFLEAGQNYAFLVELVIHYLKLTERRQVKIIYLSAGAIKAIENKQLGIKVPSLVTSEGKVQTEIFSICKRLFEILPQWKGFFLGEDDEEKEISEIKTHLKEGKQLRKKHLEGRTFFVGNHLSFADLYMFTQLYDNILEMSDEQKGQYNNLFRWYKHVQNMPQVNDFLKNTNRFMIQDPAPKYPFLAEKKKANKGKKEEKGEQPKTNKAQKSQTKNESKEKVKQAPKVEEKADKKEQTQPSSTETEAKEEAK